MHSHGNAAALLAAWTLAIHLALARNMNAYWCVGYTTFSKLQHNDSRQCSPSLVLKKKMGIHRRSLGFRATLTQGLFPIVKDCVSN